MNFVQRTPNISKFYVITLFLLSLLSTLNSFSPTKSALIETSRPIVVYLQFCGVFLNSEAIPMTAIFMMMLVGSVTKRFHTQLIMLGFFFSIPLLLKNIDLPAV